MKIKTTCILLQSSTAWGWYGNLWDVAIIHYSQLLDWKYSIFHLNFIIGSYQLYVSALVLDSTIYAVYVGNKYFR